MTVVESFDLSCASCRPLFTAGPPRPDCEQCEGKGSYPVTHHEITYRVVTTATYEITTSVDLDHADYIVEHLEHTDTWCDPLPPSVDGDIDHIEIEVDGEWRPLERDYRRGPDGEWAWVWSLNETTGLDPNVIVRDALRRTVS